ncbi:MAG: peptidase M19 [Candidatus Handelsmanbacteria bacterium RIFCSPLOWO2_12_FULL_64_10]|uniref:Peptidase M19 n=1 Tax=Handelsmanbacteria sp. (strain RIFCSPLOWO2_12_FULL_64_10) TaxID=1817868 RepID=A0A1F6C2L7_HANXR|nr:MAG: peptidase M19 [Candidatus Handelsmanbacteria bacterium RIFCSPLOWO2_12_FULL_64_10]
MFIIDAHLDLAMNALNWNRDLRRSVPEIRRQEEGMAQKGRARGTTAFPEMRRGRVGVSLATVIARVAYAPGSLDNRSHDIAYAKAQGQLAYYRILERQGLVKMIRDWPTLEGLAGAWKRGDENAPLGFILSMEGADPIPTPDDLPGWWEDGLRAVGLSHYGVSRYAHGTGTEGGLTAEGRPLLKAMEAQGVILDLTHLADQAFWEALEAFGGPVLASHNNCRALVPGGRQFTDEQVKAIVARDGVIGAALDAWMLYPGWVKGETPNTVVSLEDYVNHIDRVCQLAGDARHAAIGTDLDGGYGTEQCPHDLDTIADLRKTPGLLRKKGYKEEDVEGIMHGNWLRLFRRAWTK